MTKTDKEISAALKSDDISRALDIANKAGYHVEVYDGDAENGPSPYGPSFGFYRPAEWLREVERRIMDEVRKNY